MVLGHALERPARLELDHEQPHLPRERLVGAQDPRAAAACDERVVDGVVRLDDGAPRRVGLLADGGHQADGVVDGLGQPAVVALEREPRGLELERRAQLEQRARGRPALRLATRRAAVRLDRDEALGGERAQRGAQRVAGDAVGVGELLLAQPLAGAEVAVEDAGAQRGGERVDGRDALERERAVMRHAVRRLRVEGAHAVIRLGPACARARRA